MIVVPEAFATATAAREGAAGREWIADLPALVRALCTRWNLALDGEPMHGYLGLVIPVIHRAKPCVLKISWIDDVTSEEAIALAAWQGRGAVRLVQADTSAGAMLLERLDWSRSLEDVAIEDAVRIAGRLLRRMAIPAPVGIRGMPVIAQEMAVDMPRRWEQCGRPMPRGVLDHARELALELGTAPGNLLVNYDLHYADVLASTREAWLAVDPKVVAGVPEFGIAQLLWTRLEDIETNGGLGRLFPVLTDAAELEPALARSWTLVRCVDYWLWGLSIGLTYDPARCERIVAWLVSA